MLFAFEVTSCLLPFAFATSCSKICMNTNFFSAVRHFYINIYTCKWRPVTFEPELSFVIVIDCYFHFTGEV